MAQRGVHSPLFAAALLAPAVALMAAFPLEARTWRVRIDGGGDAPTIQAAIDSAANGDSILVGPGYYSWTNQGSGNEMGFIRIMRGKEHLTLRGEEGAELTVLDAEYRSRVVYCQGDNKATVEGFTLTHGNAPDWGDRCGGGFFTHIPEDRLRDCILIYNKAEFGGGASCVINEGYVRIERCTFIGNEATRAGAAVGLANGTGTAYISDCVMKDNISGAKGGAIYQYNTNSVITRCILSGNRAAEQGSGFFGTVAQSARISECTICRGGTTSALCGIGGSDIDIERCIVAFNGGPAALLDAQSTGSSMCCDIYGNAGGDGLPAGFVDAGGTMSLDPLFCGVIGSGNYYLRSDSPCLPNNNPVSDFCLPMGALPTGCGSVDVRETSWGGIKSLYR